jgi:hypothetical protein
MRLKRVGPPPYNPPPIFDWKELRDESPEEDREAYVIDEHFGFGTEKTSQLVVALTWRDVEAVIAVFAKMDHPQAVKLERARELATAVENLVKNSNRDTATAAAAPAGS